MRLIASVPDPRDGFAFFPNTSVNQDLVAYEII